MYKQKKPKNMILYICPDCDLLLLNIDAKEVTYCLQTLEEDGCYTTRHEEPAAHDYYLCPTCGTRAILDDPPLQEICLPIKAAKDIISLWEQLKMKNADDTKDYGYGIPMKNDELKGLLTAHKL